MKILKSVQTSMIPELAKPTVSVSFNNQNYFIPFKGMSKAQEHLFNGLSDSDKINYLFSFLAKPKKVTRLSVPHKTDVLANRSKHHFLNLLRNRCDTSTFKRPMHTDKKFHFGIEIECFIPWKSLDLSPSYGSGETECYNCEGSGDVTTYDQNDNSYEHSCSTCGGVGVVESDDDSEIDYSEAHDELSRYLKDRTIKGCQIHDDSSIDPEDSDYFTVEISCLTSDFKNLEKLCKALSELGAEVNSSCGLHVHMDMRHADSPKMQVFKHNAEKSLDVLFKMLPENRRTSTYCRKRWSSEKYSAFTTCHIENYGTVEMRAHSGTVNFEKIKNWCDILKSIYDCEIYAENVKNTRQFAETFKIPNELRQYMVDRINLFKGSDE